MSNKQNSKKKDSYKAPVINPFSKDYGLHYNFNNKYK